MNRFGFEDRHWEILEREAFVPLTEKGAVLWVFGSRARGDHRPFSDLDVLIENFGDRRFLSAIAERIEESRFPVRVDFVLEDDLAESYRERIRKDRRRISPG